MVVPTVTGAPEVLFRSCPGRMPAQIDEHAITIASRTLVTVAILRMLGRAFVTPRWTRRSTSGRGEQIVSAAAIARAIPARPQSPGRSQVASSHWTTSMMPLEPIVCVMLQIEPRTAAPVYVGEEDASSREASVGSDL